MSLSLRTDGVYLQLGTKATIWNKSDCWYNIVKVFDNNKMMKLGSTYNHFWDVYNQDVQINLYKRFNNNRIGPYYNLSYETHLYRPENLIKSVDFYECFGITEQNNPLNALSMIKDMSYEMVEDIGLSRCSIWEIKYDIEKPEEDIHSEECKQLTNDDIKIKILARLKLYEYIYNNCNIDKEYCDEINTIMNRWYENNTKCSQCNKQNCLKRFCEILNKTFIYIYCDNCDKYLYGCGYQCVECEEYHICEQCYETKQDYHDNSHTFKFITSDAEYPTKIGISLALDVNDCDIIKYNDGNMYLMKGFQSDTCDYVPYYFISNENISNQCEDWEDWEELNDWFKKRDIINKNIVKEQLTKLKADFDKGIDKIDKIIKLMN